MLGFITQDIADRWERVSRTYQSTYITMIESVHHHLWLIKKRMLLLDETAKTSVETLMCAEEGHIARRIGITGNT